MEDAISNEARLLGVMGFQDDLVMEVIVETNQEIEDILRLSREPEASDDSELFQNNALEQLNRSRSSSSASTIINPFEEENQELTDTSKIPEPLTKKRKLSDSENEDDGKLCSICLDNWTNSGEHRICALKCGHLFGHSCILRWISANRLCPTCKLKGSRRDIRFIYANKLIAMDVTELDIIKKQLDITVEERNRIQIDLTKAICKEHLLNQEICNYKEKINKLSLVTQSLSQQKVDKVPTSSENGLKLEESFQICPQGTCRVMDVHYGSRQFAISLKSPNTLFQGYGVRRYNMDTFTPIGYTPLHSKPIRDIKFRRNESYLLSVSLDKVLKIIDCNSNTQIAAYTGQNMLWSCCWGKDRRDILYAGEQNGSVLQFDMRQMNAPLEIFQVAGDMSPVVSVESLQSGPESCALYGGIVSCKLNSIWAFERLSSGGIQKHMLSSDGPFVAMSYNNLDKQLLVSARPNSRNPSARNIISNLEKRDEKISCNIVHTFTGGRLQKQLSRPCFVKNGVNTYVAGQQEGSLILRSCNTGDVFSKMPLREPVLDLTTFNNGVACYVLSLSEKRLDCFKFRNDQ